MRSVAEYVSFLGIDELISLYHVICECAINVVYLTAKSAVNNTENFDFR